LLAFLLGISCGTISFEAFAQSDRPASLSGRVTIHQVNVAFIASAAAGGGTFNANAGVARSNKPDDLEVKRLLLPSR
jgi:hypothetical protein